MANADFYAQSYGENFGLTGPTVARQGKGQTGLEYQIIGTTVQTLILRLAPGQTVYTSTGGIGWMSQNIQMNTSTRGGMSTVLKRMISGGSLFLVEYFTQEGEGLLAFTSTFPGHTVPVHIEADQPMIVQRNRLLCAEANIELGVCLQKTLSTSLLGGLDFVMQWLTGTGAAFICLDGDSVIYTLAPDQVLGVDPELIAMYDPTVTIDFDVIDGFKNILFSGRRICRTTLRGPGRVFLQMMTIEKLVKAMTPYFPRASSTTDGGTRERARSTEEQRAPKERRAPEERRPPKKDRPSDDTYHIMG
ncbi:hypothetical protein U27_02646 [Candidatus Vecturithrix granuli]|uniref:Altered inheritance of mitochondria protein 24, mitochondrial n=1 Tax=Vecturithrix granuli TaxID=1499967 RepID=A0A081BTN4_VECG1|nr:hypothetical protein U27_02646 [Candidatus Vecturithrix granuli]